MEQLVLVDVLGISVLAPSFVGLVSRYSVTSLVFMQGEYASQIIGFSFLGSSVLADRIISLNVNTIC